MLPSNIYTALKVTGIASLKDILHIHPFGAAGRDKDIHTAIASVL
jgi:hypothetical protein